MAPVANPSMFMRFFGLIENQPLYLMVSIACGLAVYTPIRHLVTASDVAIQKDARDIDYVYSPDTMARARRYEGGVLGAVASVRKWPEVWNLPAWVHGEEHFHTARWPAPRSFELPAELKERP